MNRLAQSFASHLASYQNTAETNDRIFAEFTAATAADPLLAQHRAHVEKHQLGFGDPAFHALWQELLAAAVDRFGTVDALEIGVFKGQVVSLWALLAETHGWNVRIHGITPFAGQPMPKAGWWRSLQSRLNPWFKERIQSGDFYPEDDYAEIVRRHFAHHQVSFDAVRWLKGFSNEQRILEAVKNDRFHVIYVDGGHTFEAAAADIDNFAPKVPVGGWIVMDDAAFDLPGTKFWKGYESVARACRKLPELGFKNVLNVGHNRVFQRV